MINLFRYLTGYITVCISGENCEQMLNLCAKHSIRLWNLHLKKGGIIGNIKTQDFYRLRKIRPKRVIKMHIIKKTGLNFKASKYKNRFGFVAGLAIFIAILTFLSSFIWNIEIIGNSYVSDKEILTICRNIGVEEGTRIKDIDTLKSAQNLLIRQNKLAWASFNIEGSKLTVNVTEIKRADEEENQDAPSNLIASFDGEIKKIDVTMGNVLVKIGDTVQKGDILVSGIIESQSSTCFVGSKGSVEAQTKRVFTVNGNYKQTLNIKTGEIKKRSVLEIFTVRIPLYLGAEKRNFISNQKINKTKLFGVYLPIKRHIKTMEITDAVKVVYTEDELIENLSKELQNKIKNAGLDIKDEGEAEVIFTETGITLKKTLLVNENIAEKQPILINSIN